MSDAAQCACLTVKYLTKPAEGGGVSGWWCCTSCGNQFIPWGAHRFLRDEAVSAALAAVCVKKQEAETMGGLEGAALEQALKEDAKDREMANAAKRPYHPPAVRTVPLDSEVAKVLRDGLMRDSERAGEVARHKLVPQESSPTEGDLPAPSVATIKAELEQKKPTDDLPAGMKMAMWVPIKQGDGTTIFQCSVEGFGLRASASSRSKQKALAYCLEDLARQMVEADRG